MSFDSLLTGSPVEIVLNIVILVVWITALGLLVAFIGDDS